MFAIKEYYTNQGRQMKINARLFAMALPKVNTPVKCGPHVRGLAVQNSFP
jgi:hypothetical protein